jgi:outer membrane protein OmpA-like peptidoglycan-associated protein
MSSYDQEKYHSWTWGIAALLALALLWLWITGRGPGLACCNGAASVAAAPVAASPAAPPAPAPVTATPPVTAPPPLAAAPAAPVAAAVAKPKATLYFATGKIDVPADTNNLLADVVAYLKANPASKVVISGYNDPRGDAAMNAELSKNRAKSARESLRSAGIEDARIEMRKPSDTNLGGDPKEARRVEITVEP